MNPEKRQRVLAAALVALLAFVGARFLMRSLSGGSSDTPGLEPLAMGEQVALPDLVALRLADLEQESGEYHPGRDPFRFAPRKAPVRQQQRRRQPPRRGQQRQQQRRTPPPPAGPQPPAVDFRFLGSFGPSERRIAVFADAADLYNARVGDVVKEHFVVDSIGYESADLRFVNFPDVPAKRLAAGG